MAVSNHPRSAATPPHLTTRTEAHPTSPRQSHRPNARRNSPCARNPTPKPSSSRRKRAAGSDQSEDDDNPAPASSSPAVPEHERRRSRRTTSGGAETSKKTRKSYMETADSDDDKLLEYLDDQHQRGAKKANGARETPSSDDELSNVPDDLDDEGDVHMGSDGETHDQGSGTENGEQEDELAQPHLVGTPSRRRNNRQPNRADSPPSASRKPAAATAISKSKKQTPAPSKPTKTNAVNSRAKATSAMSARKDMRRFSAEKARRAGGARSTRNTRNAGKTVGSDDGMGLPGDSE